MIFPSWRNSTLRIYDFLVIIGLAIFFYGLVPVAGAFASRHSWRQFRRRFDELRLRPLLDYGVYRGLQAEGESYRFIGGFESVTDGRTLWIHSENLTIPVSLRGAQTYILPMQEGDATAGAFDPGEEAPERIRWDRVSTLTEGAKVFVGGSLVFRDNRWIFAAANETPLLVIFYDGPDRSLTARAIRAGRHRNEYWNALTPYALIVGALCLIAMAAAFLNRPAFRLTTITAFIAVFIPLFPLLPPGVLCTVVYRRLWWRARIFRAHRDLVKLPLRYLPQGEGTCRLPGGEWYGAYSCAALPEETRRALPLLILDEGKRKKEGWYVFGALPGPAENPGPPEEGLIPVEPEDPFATYGILPGRPETLARRYTREAYTLEIIAWLMLLAGIGLNAFFVGMIFFLLG
jgi:hypothetical protein